MLPWLGPRQILLAGWALVIVFAYPGFVSPDSIIQLHQARDWHFTDQHPAMMGVVWRVLDTIVPGMLPMLLVQTGLLLFGIYGLIRRGIPERRAAIATACIVVFPAVLVVMAAVWKDSQMAGWLMCGFSLVLSAERRVRLAGLAVLMVGTGMRHNAFAALFPLLFVAFEWRPGMPWLKRHAIAVGVFLGVAGGAAACNRALTVQKVYFFENSLAPFDISGVLAHSRTLKPGEVDDALAGVPLMTTADPQQEARRLYDPTNYWQLNHDGLFSLIFDDTSAAAMFRAWKTLVTAHPYRYLQHRRKLWTVLLTDPMSPVWMSHEGIKGQDELVHHDAAMSPVQTVLSETLERHEDSIVFRPYVYLMVALLLIPLAWRQRDVLALLTSGLLYELSFFFLAATTDYRYSHWMITCVIVSAVTLFLRRLGAATRENTHVPG